MATVDEDRQAGSGFAMFSSVDFANSRMVSIEGEIDGLAVAITPPRSFSDDLESLVNSPTTARASRLATSLQLLDWSVANGVATVGTDTKIAKVRVVVRRLTANGRTLWSQVLVEGVGQ